VHHLVVIEIGADDVELRIEQGRGGGCEAGGIRIRTLPGVRGGVPNGQTGEKEEQERAGKEEGAAEGGTIRSGEGDWLADGGLLLFLRSGAW